MIALKYFIHFQQITCVVLGSSGVGKTSMILRYVTGKFNKNLLSTSYEEYSKNVIIDGKAINLKVWDTSGDELDRMRASFYYLANVFLVCFSIDLPNSFKDVKLKWISEISNHNPKIPVILVGTKSDLRSNKSTVEKLKKNKQVPVSYKDGMGLTKQIGAAKYLECSALEQKEVNKVFEESIHFVLNPTPHIRQRKEFFFKKKKK